MNKQKGSRFLHPFLPIITALFQSYVTLFFIVRTGNLTTRNPLAPGLFFLLFLFYRHPLSLEGLSLKLKKRLNVISVLLGGFFTLLTGLASGSIWVQSLDNRLFQLLIAAVCLIGCFCFYKRLLVLLYRFGLTAQPAAAENHWLFPKKQKGSLPLITFFACLLLWLPYFLYEFPGIMSPDSINQLEQVMGIVPYSNHHPWVHTMILGLFYSIGRLFTTDPSVAVSFFTGFQLCFMAFCAAYLVDTLAKFRLPRWILLLTCAFYSLLPYHGVLAVTLWKDVLFSGMVLLFTLSLLRLLPGLSLSMKKGAFFFTCIVYAISGILFCLLRSNGWYAFLITLPFLFYCFRRQLKTMLPLHLLILGLVLIVKGPVMTANDVTQPDLIESLCIPLQQISRVLVNDRALTGEQEELIHSVIDTTYIKELYAPGFADNMKELVRAGHPEVLAAKKGAFFRLWLSLGLRYPGDYLAAYVDQTVGYWYPDVEYRVADIDGVIANDIGVMSHPLIGGKLVVKVKEILLKLGDMLPLYGLLWSMGAMFWGLLLSASLTWLRGETSRLILFLPGLALIGTLLLATPVSSEFRYAYALAYTLPLYLLIPFFPNPVRDSGESR